MIALKLKTSEHCSWSDHLTSAIAEIYGTASEFKHEIEVMDRMRDAAINISPTSSGRDILYKYFAQMELLSLHVPMRPFKTQFAWYNLYEDELVTQSSSAFEKACILYNLAACLSHLGSEAQSAGDNKSAYHDFCSAAGIFDFISENFLHPASVDLQSETLICLRKLMLAQAQHCFFLKAQESKSAAGLVAKLAASAVGLYRDVLESLEKLYDENYWGEKENLRYLEKSINDLHAASMLFEAQNYESQLKYGNCIALLKEAKKYISDKREVQDLNQRIKVLDRDNDLIYHERIPACPPEIQETLVAKPLPLSSLYGADADVSKIMDKDLFERMVPVSVHEKASVYSEMKAQFFRDEQEKAEVADLKLTSALEYMDLPAAISNLRVSNDSVQVPPEVLEMSYEVNSLPISSVQTNFDGQRERILSYVRMQQTPSETSNIIKQSLVNCKKSDSKLEELKQLYEKDIQTLQNVEELESFYHKAQKDPAFESNSLGNQMSLLDLDAESTPDNLDNELDKVSNLVVKLKKIMAERKSSLTELRKGILEDDITQSLVAHQNVDKNEIVETVLKPEMKKFDNHVRRIEATIRLQSAVLNDVAEAWKQVLESKSAKRRMNSQESETHRIAAATERLKLAYSSYLQIIEGSNKAKQFYDNLERNALGSASSDSAAQPRLGNDFQQNPPPIPRKPSLPPKENGLSGYTTPSTYDPSMYH
ncbi:Bro1 protein [Starmerella bacillaris]|uniref:BRO domain-containing protein 1 n=1 Tax=Starmerella bacillaris TaxID=1247836 RepID=A0AAV5RIN7_STABA|nr:Bro1 protein [Starmerella bacillaris]